MSVKVLSKVWEHYPRGGSEFLALLALADWSDDKGYCHPSIASIAKKIRLSPDQARRLVHRLVDSGYLKVVGAQKGGRRSCRYQILIGCFQSGADGTASSGSSTSCTGASTPCTSAVDPLHSCASRTVTKPSINRQNTSRINSSAQFDAKATLMALGVSEQVAADWLETRKEKRAIVTQTAIAGIRREAENANISLTDALSISCERGWAGFRAAWIDKPVVNSLVEQKQPKVGDRRERHGGLEVYCEGVGCLPQGRGHHAGGRRTGAVRR